MTRQGRSPACEHCLDYLSGICTEEEQQAFERHLPSCESCRQELKELRVIWEALPSQMEYMEPPASLKRQVMDAVRESDAVLLEQARSQGAGRERSRLFGRTIKASLAAAAICGIALLSLWNVQLHRQQSQAPISIEQALSVSAAEIKDLVMLQPISPEAARSAGVACIVDNGQSKQFVVYLFGAKPTSGDEAYQVWLIQDGKRTSAGTFRVAEADNGIGLLAMPIAEGKLAFDAIGITLEPDDQGSQPRGTRIYGSA